jgi:hypothetical protein
MSMYPKNMFFTMEGLNYQFDFHSNESSYKHVPENVYNSNSLITLL